ncbi:MAG: FHA domain-containing protein [Verrucomicrobiales bacterium]|nr:FHA domain-containing protein [Verrucomicrobiales bacterium]
MNAKLVNVATGEASDLAAVSMLGRSGECNVVIADPRVSRRHAMIRKQDDGFWFFDLGSFNGTYLNGSRVTAARKLNQGDVLDIAGNQLEFQQEGAALSGDNFDEDDFGASTIALIRSTPLIMLVSDVKGFTSLSEKLPPDDLAQIIGGWYASCEMVMAEHGATVDKFIGDCVLAYWTEVGPNQRLAALKAARDLVQACEDTYHSRRDLFESHDVSFEAGLALHIGKVAYGGMSQGEFTLLGDPVNLTFRLETLTRELGCGVVTSGDFVNDWPEGKDYCENLGVHQVKGRAQGTEVWAVRSFPE